MSMNEYDLQNQDTPLARSISYQAIGVVLLTSLIFLSVMVYLFVQGRFLASHHAPLVYAVQEIKLETTTGHLWFEEIISGDQSLTLEDALVHMDRADWYVKASLNGGQRGGITFYPLELENLREELVEVGDILAQFRQVALLRHQQNIDAKPGSEIDQRFDAIFKHFITKANYLTQSLQNEIKNDLVRYYTISVLVFVFSVGVTIALLIYLHRQEKFKQTLLETLATSNRQVRHKNRELSYKAHFDDLTHLPNRVLFFDRLAQTINEAKRDQKTFALLFIDLDHFKMINDQYGHQAGDFVLQETARRLKSCVREVDTLSRLSGDEFTTIVRTFSDVSETAKNVQKIATSILSEMNQPFEHGEMTGKVTASIGIAIYPNDGATAEELVQHADAAMYVAKGAGKNNFHFHNDQLAKHTRDAHAV